MSPLTDIRENAEDLITKLPLPDERQRNVFRQYLEAFMVVFSRSTPETILEIGSGFSTYLLAKIAAKTGANVTTVDLDLGRNFKQLVSECRESSLCERVRFVNGLSVRHSEFQDFYRAGILDRFGDIDIGVISSNMNDFFLLAGDDRKYRKLIGHYGLGDRVQNLKEHLLRDDRFHFDPFLLEVYGFKEESRFVREHDNLCAVFDTEVLRQTRYDVVFFDSGEFSSNIEFLKLKDKIPPGGHAVFHDISFPKSVKNFLPCSYIHAKPAEWAIRYLDNRTTPQGIMVAQRL